MVREILVEQRGALERLTERLLEKEVLDADNLKEVMEATAPRIVPGTLSVHDQLRRTPDVEGDAPSVLAE
jgi:hypothetical protein